MFRVHEVEGLRREGGARMGASSPRLVSSNLLKRSVKKMMGAGGGAQMGASGPGGAEAGFEQFVKEKC